MGTSRFVTSLSTERVTLGNPDLAAEVKAVLWGLFFPTWSSLYSLQLQSESWKDLAAWKTVPLTSRVPSRLVTPKRCWLSVVWC